MNLFDVYSLWEIEPVRAQGCHVWDSEGTKYLDLYGGHAVISIGHSHPHYVKAVQIRWRKLASTPTRYKISFAAGTGG
jgi:acetylornithine aminotransferase